MHSDYERTTLSEVKRKEIFLALVEAQDNGMAVGKSRTEIESRFGITAEQRGQIENDGIKGQWPPLGSAEAA